MAARKTKKAHGVTVTAPDFGAVFDDVAELIREKVNEHLEAEAYRAKDFIVGYIKSNMAKPAHFSKAYFARKAKLGYDTRHLIRTGFYADSIEVFRERKRSGFDSFKVGFDPERLASTGGLRSGKKRTVREKFIIPSVSKPYRVGRRKRVFKRRPPYFGLRSQRLSLAQLANFLEFGTSGRRLSGAPATSESLMTPLRKKKKRKSASLGGGGIAPRPHWRVLAAWFHAQRMPILSRKIAREVKKGLKKLGRWEEK